MNKLLTANFFRLKKNKLFRILCVLAFLGSLIMVFDTYDYNRQQLNRYGDAAAAAPSIQTAFHILYNFTPFLGLMAGLMTAMFIGTEYHDNTLRNKLICGQPRTRVYFANLLTGLGITVVLWLLPVLTVLLVGGPLLGFPKLTAASVTLMLIYGAIGLLLCAAHTAVYTLAAMLIHNRSYALMACFVAALLFLFIGSFCEGRLSEPEFTSGVSITTDEDGTTSIEPGEPLPNPFYISGNARKCLIFLYDLLPGGQAIQLAQLDVAHPYLLPLYSLAILILATAVGITVFAKKDLR